MFTHVGKHPSARKTKTQTSCCYYGGPVWQAGPADSYCCTGGGNLIPEVINDCGFPLSTPHFSSYRLPQLFVTVAAPPLASQAWCTHTHPLTHSLTHCPQPSPPSTTPECQPISCPDSCCQRKNKQSFLVLSGLRPLFHACVITQASRSCVQIDPTRRNYK